METGLMLYLKSEFGEAVFFGDDADALRQAANTAGWTTGPDSNEVGLFEIKGNLSDLPAAVTDEGE